jgi:CheY-specific phosphatase CheX
MFDADILQALESSTEAVLGTMFFADAMPGSGVCPIENGMRAELEFHGAPPGRFTLEVSLDTAREIAANFLGLSPVELSQGQTCDVIREMANMVCGSVVSSLERDSTFDLAAPRILSEPSGETSGHVFRRSFEIDGGGLEVCLELYPDNSR